MRKACIMRAVFFVGGGSVGRYRLARKVSSLRLSFFLSVFVSKDATLLLNIPGTVADHNPLSRGGPLVAFFLSSHHAPRLSHLRSKELFPPMILVEINRHASALAYTLGLSGPNKQASE